MPAGEAGVAKYRYMLLNIETCSIFRHGGEYAPGVLSSALPSPLPFDTCVASPASHCITLINGIPHAVQRHFTPLMPACRGLLLPFITIYGRITLDSAPLYHHIWTHNPRFYSFPSACRGLPESIVP
jgi:hypothetical protein